MVDQLMTLDDISCTAQQGVMVHKLMILNDISCSVQAAHFKWLMVARY